jgi:HTH-type transcriptional repressor of NAD biosynthesis genes
MNFLDRPKRGFLLGKFMPPHQGHVFMCEFARQYCERLTILVGTLPDDPIPGQLRYQWMKEMFPDCDVVWCNEVLPQEPKGPDDDAFWDIWRQTCLDALNTTWEVGDPATVDVVFASEAYGQRLASELGAEFVPVDLTRTARAISGTAIRSDPFANWEYIPDVVKPHFVKRVCVFGPESTGKSTLALALGKHYHTVVAPEYGRTYTEVFGADVNADDLRKIVHGHIASVAATKRQANRILIEDTDPVMTAVWSDLLIGQRHDWFNGFDDYADLYLLCDVDIPWVNDGTRYFSSDEKRKHFYDVCEAELKSRSVRYEVIRGGGMMRYKSAVAAIDRHFFSERREVQGESPMAFASRVMKGDQ